VFLRARAEGIDFELLDPDASILRDSLPFAGYEPAVCALLKRALTRPDAIFLDVGALYGFFTVWASKTGAAEVVAFEPGHRYAEVLDYNLRLNGCEGVRVERRALSDRNGTGSLAARTLSPDPGPKMGRPYVHGLLNHLRRSSPTVGERIVAAEKGGRDQLGPWLSAAIAEKLGLFAQGGDQDEGDVALERLDDWVKRTGITPTVVKIDVHGGEVAVVRGMPELLGSQPLEVVIEVHTSDLLVTGSHDELLTHLEAAELAVFEVKGFRSRRAQLVPLSGSARHRFCDQETWTASELYFMRCLYARRP